MEITLRNLEEIYQRKGYIINPKFNLVGVRAPNKVSGNFDDLIGYFSPDTREYALYQGTTDPGTPMLTTPMNAGGAAILVPGQYPDVYTLGFHRGNKAHPAFIQSGPMRIYRDNNLDNILDYLPNTVARGMFGINLHRADATLTLDKVGQWSAGCQVVRRKISHDTLRKEATESGLKTFTYTLLLESDL